MKETEQLESYIASTGCNDCGFFRKFYPVLVIREPKSDPISFGLGDLLPT
ncbi:MAG TPA: hypothetical protein GX735_03125 [Firmicutes bacterium]|nr:hypothetical protein [Bacillota bacterium]